MSALVDAWQEALAAEHRASFAYSVLGPRLQGADKARAVNCSDAHDQLRDRTSAALATAGQTPVTPLADYPELYPVADAVAARRLAARVEADCAVAWRYLYLEAASGSDARAEKIRPAAQAALTASAVRATQWRVLVDPARATEAFPGTR